MDANGLSHTKWNCKYHIVFAPKFRRKVAYGELNMEIDILASRILCRYSRKGCKENPRVYTESIKRRS